jgi:hypothetical protein
MESGAVGVLLLEREPDAEAVCSAVTPSEVSTPQVRVPLWIPRVTPHARRR